MRIVITNIMVFLLATAANAQGLPSSADPAESGEEYQGDSGVVDIREVERGFYFAADIGANYYLNLPFPGFVSLNQTWLQPGQRFGLRMGYDVLNNINVELFFNSNFNRGEVSEDLLEAGSLTGDVSHFVPGVSARFAFFTTERFFLYGRLGAGLGVWTPAGNAEGSLTAALLDELAMGFYTDASLGFEYYTKLRHISFGFELTGQGLYLPFAFGVQVYPTMKYTF
jgi:hypothetical protein